jgi:hypothetical protein
MNILKAYNIGSIGVDLVNSPIHVEDTALLNGQNAQISPHDAELAIRKRDGMVKINASVAAGRIKAIFNIPTA